MPSTEIRNPSTRTVKIQISVKKVTQILGVCIALLVTASTLGQLSKFYLGHVWVFGFVPRFALDGEGNVPSWYSSGTLLTICVLLAAISGFARQTGDSWWRYWSGLSALFLWLSMDEAASFHELLTSPVRRWLGAGGMFYWAWVVPGLMFIGVLAVVYMRFVLALPRFTRTLFILSALTFLAGALGVEMLVGPWVETRG